MANLPAHAEAPGSPTEVAGGSAGFTATRKLICDWGNRISLSTEILGEGYPHVGGTGSIALTASINPIEAKLTGEGGEGAVEATVIHEKALVTVTYGREDQGKEPREGNYFEDFVPTGEFLTVDYRALYWNTNVDDNLLVQITDGASLGKLFFAGDYILKRFGLSKYPTGKLALIGKINSGTFATQTTYMSDMATFAIGTLLFQPPTMEYELQPDYTYKINATYRMNYKPNTHNKFWYPGSPDLAAGWLQPRDSDGDVIDIYEKTAFGTF